ncbi:MAG: ABC transporter ATP-binding protein [Candidatus Eisenbacteria bacterium]
MGGRRDTQQTERAARPDQGAPRGGRIAWLWRYWRGHRSVLIFLLFFTLVSTAVAVSYPLVFRWVLDRLSGVLGGAGGGNEVGPVMLVLAAILVGRFIAGLYPATRAMMNLRLEVGIREDVFRRLMQKDYRFNARFRTGDIVTRLTDDIAEFPKVAWFGCSGIFRALESSSRLIFCLAAMALLNWKLAVIAVIPLPIMMWIFYSLRHRMRYYMRESQQTISKTNDMLEAAFTGVRIVKAFRAEDGQRRRLAELMAERVRVFFGLISLQALVNSLDTTASRVGQMIVLALGGYMVMRGETSIGTLYAFYVYLDLLAQPMMDIPFLFMAGQQAFVSIDRIEEIRSFPVGEERSGVAQIEEVKEIAFEGVSFAYDGGREILTDVSFRMPAGGKVAVVGAVASGKSTMLKMIAGIVSPTRGRVLVNGRDLREWNWDGFRTLVGYVPQEGVLFSKSISENVLFGRATPPDFASREEWVAQCLSVAQMDGDLAQMAEGIETVVGQKGGLVSGGQKQRVAIARALAGLPQVLLLDDCTAALDAHNEDLFWKQLDERFGGRTSIIVSHRLATIRKADRILVLEGGRLVDHGTHEELALRCATYQEFLQIERAKAHLEMAGVG